LDLASSLLPSYSYLKPSLLFHIHLHAKSQSLFAKKTIDAKSIKISRHSILALIDNLESIVKSLKWRNSESEWGNYYEDTNYTQNALNHKQSIVAEFLKVINPKTVWDLGANNGLFSDIAGKEGALTVSFDNDPVAVEKNYLKCVQNENRNTLPLILDLSNPSPAIGWENQERMSLSERGPADAVMALALIHHLAISNNLPFDRIANFLKGICSWLIVEFVPKDDSQVQKLLSTREDIFPHYTQEEFERAFGNLFIIHKKLGVKDSQRALYLMQKIS
jgi:ribosomal protein L11 methylase PrmA